MHPDAVIPLAFSLCFKRWTSSGNRRIQPSISRFAQIGHQETDVGGPAMIRPPSAGESAQAVVDGRVSAPVDAGQAGTFKPRGHRTSPGMTSDKRPTSRVRLAPRKTQGTRGPRGYQMRD